MYLFEAIALAPEAVLGREHLSRYGTGLGILVKYLDAKEQYILQAHPRRAFAREMWNSEYGKEESWYVIGVRDDVRERPYIILGFKEGITPGLWREYFFRDDLEGLENLCHRIPIKTGDAFFVGAGVPHALGAGCFVVEVQEPSDITVIPVPQMSIPKHFSKYLPEEERDKPPPWFIPEDEELYNRKVLGSFVYEGCDYEENLKRWKIPPETIWEGEGGTEYRIIGPKQTAYFSCSRMDIRGRAPVRHTGFPRIAMVISGNGIFHFDGGGLSLRQGDEIFLPHSIPAAELEGELSLMLCCPGSAPPRGVLPLSTN
jgi:mannose-6-phosphate isomerase